MQQFTQDGSIVNVCGCRNKRMDDLARTVDANMRLHPEVPLVALLGLMHLRIPLFRFVLSRAWRGNNRRINDRTSGDFHAALAQVRVDFVEELLPEAMPLQEMAELADRRLVRYRRVP